MDAIVSFEINKKNLGQKKFGRLDIYFEPHYKVFVYSFLKRDRRLFLSPLRFMLSSPALGLDGTPLKATTSALAHILAPFSLVSITLDSRVLPYQLGPGLNAKVKAV